MNTLRVAIFCVMICIFSPISSAQIIGINPNCPATTHVISDHTPEQIHIQLKGLTTSNYMSVMQNKLPIFIRKLWDLNK